METAPAHAGVFISDMDNPKKDNEGPQPDGLTGDDRKDGDKRDVRTEPMPEGLKRERKGPYDRSIGRRGEN